MMRGESVLDGLDVPLASPARKERLVGERGHRGHVGRRLVRSSRGLLRHSSSVHVVKK